MAEQAAAVDIRSARLSGGTLDGTARSYFITRTIEGGGPCGEVRYRIQGEPLASCTCQCRTCRKVSAAAIVPWLHLDEAAFSFIAGKPVDFKSSPPVTRTFCGLAARR